MALIDVDVTTLVCLTEADCLKMVKAIKGKPDFWIRVISTVSTADAEIAVTVLLQGPDGEEEELIKTIEQ